MTSPADPGATGKKLRGGAASQAPAAPQSPLPPVEPPAPSLAQTETSIAALAAAGTSEQAAQAAEKPVVVGAAEIPLEPGGPGAGAARVAEEVEGVASRPVAGSTAYVAELNAAERAELDELRRLRLGGDAFAATMEPDVARHVQEGQRLAAGLSARQGVVIDAASVHEIRLAQAATRVLRDGRTYTTGEPVPLDFAAYTELVGIGAIVNDRWADLPMVGEA